MKKKQKREEYVPSQELYKIHNTEAHSSGAPPGRQRGSISRRDEGFPRISPVEKRIQV
jgi:hypothetical protein